MSTFRFARLFATVASFAVVAVVPVAVSSTSAGTARVGVAAANGAQGVPVAVRVRVPSNTPAGTQVYVERLSQAGIGVRTDKLKSLGSNLYGATIDVVPGTLLYRYMRNGWGFTAAEEFTPDSEQGHRAIKVTRATKSLTDTVNKWRWLPKSDAALVVPPSAAGNTSFLPRVGSRQFQKGMEFADFWWGNFHTLLDTTNASMKRDRVQWVEIAPTWDYAKTNPPVMTNEGFGHTYPDADLITHINATKKAGFKVFLAPQVCCVDLSKVEKTAKWWNSWFDQYEAYSLHFADVAARTGVDQLALYGDWAAIDSKPAGYAERLETIYAKVRQHFRGPIGRTFYLGGVDGAAEPVWPSPADMPGMAQWDFLAVNWWAGLSANPSAAQAELNESALRIMKTSLAPMAAQYGKPVVLSQISYPSVVGGVTGRIGVFDSGIQMWNAYDPSMVLDLQGQAMAYEAVLNAVAQSPYVIGTYPFVYWPDEFPLSKEHNIRGKPAAEVVSGWYARIN
ncbi:MAG: hypothetical protein Q8L05_11425 [Actinomycetota bacterium]|nr:hypothetical protein [Actinomycetota bacterium]MDP2287602.1 hypothetical protein [Actinomycetota bacterium]